MTEDEYIKATNLANVSAALNLIRDVLGGTGYGVSESDMQEIRSKLSKAEDELRSSFELNKG